MTDTLNHAAAGELPSEWKLFADHFRVDPETIDYDGLEWKGFVEGVKAARAADRAQLAQQGQVADAIAKLHAAKSALDREQGRAAGSHAHVDAANQYQLAVFKLVEAALAAPASAQPADPRIEAFYKLRDMAERDGDPEAASIIQAAIAKLGAQPDQQVSDALAEPMGYAIFRGGQQVYVERSKRQAESWVDAQIVPLYPAPQQPAARVAVPDGVYFDAEADNFYSAVGFGMGTAFYKRWQERAAEFPASRSALLAASPATVAAPAQADWCKECVGQGIDTDPPEPGADDTCRACNGSGLATVNEPATAGMVGPDQEHVNRIVSDEDKTALLSIVKDLEWSVNGTFIVTKSGDQMHTLDALAFARVARAYRAGMVGQDAKDAAPPFQLDPYVTYVCAERDIECGGRAANWCEKCPKRRATLAAQ